MNRRFFIKALSFALPAAAGVAVAATAELKGRRISMSKDDPGYSPLEGLHAKVFLDGVEQKSCVTADERTGEVYLYDLESTKLTPYLKEIPLIIKRGRVVIKLNCCL